MKLRRRTPERIVRKLREIERLLGEGRTIPEAAKAIGIRQRTLRRWRNQITVAVSLEQEHSCRMLKHCSRSLTAPPLRVLDR